MFLSPGKQHLSPGAVSRYPTMSEMGFTLGLLASCTQGLIVSDLLRKLLLILGSGGCQPLGCPTALFPGFLVKTIATRMGAP